MTYQKPSLRPRAKVALNHGVLISVQLKAPWKVTIFAGRLVLELSNENSHDAASRWGKAHGITCVLTTLASFHADIDHLMDLEAMKLGEIGYSEQATHTETREQAQRA